MSTRLEPSLERFPSIEGSLAHSAGRDDVQGLRGIAVLLVVLYHAGVPGLPGGFVGVDVFFVISGFLITGLLVRESLATGHIDFTRFFARRARRLLPAALLVTAIAAVVAMWIYPPMEQREIVSSARAASLYVGNHWLAGRSVDYLGGDQGSNPLLHMWSLAVEEQFYLVWPFIVLLGTRLGGVRGLFIVIGGLSAVSLCACVAMTWHSQPWAFFLMPFRAWQFGLGALVQVALVRGVRFSNDAWPRWISWIGLGLIAASTALLDTSRLYPGLWALAPTVGTASVLLGLYATKRGAGVLLAIPPLRVVGDLSYSWYLWHWPFLVAAHVLVPQSGPAVTVAAVVLSLVAAAVSYRWVEGPIRFSPPAWLRRNRQALVAALAGSALLAGACTAATAWIGSRSMDAQQRAFADGVDDIPIVYAAGCHATFAVSDLPRCAFGSKDAGMKVVLFGDSHAAQWFPALQQLATERGWQLISLTKSSCPAARVTVYSDVLRRTYLECDEWRERMLKRIEAERPALVVLSNAYQQVDAAQWKAGAASTADRLARAGARQLWIRDAPSPGYNVPRCLARAQWQGYADFSEICAFDRDKVLARSAAIFEAERSAVTASPDARLLDFTTQVCPDKQCTVWRAGHPLFSDGNHIAASWTKGQSGRIAEALQGWPLDSAAAVSQPIR
ncbi:acyltransferase family protein [Scleromatobacter humisilvae]|uniref:Acyltransferase n=1 Tax=Scleromatobacter humisilvae TaxID=2897159 RepID=A0A9X2C0F0_9BURK|nr:acyltransferase family protein [Scleromatobacter humisilvae]MCK9686356.1 acyltransferase [Scleromatobacter humisilvae]